MTQQKYVYAAKSPTHPLIKIGVSQCPYSRARTFSKLGFGKFEIIGVLEGGFDLERKTHKSLHSSRVTGEWFAETDEVTAFLETMLPPDCAAPKVFVDHVKTARHDLMENVAKKAFELRIELSQLCVEAGLSASVLHRFRKYGKPPTLPTIGKLEKALERAEKEKAA